MFNVFILFWYTSNKRLRCSTFYPIVVTSLRKYQNVHCFLSNLITRLMKYQDCDYSSLIFTTCLMTYSHFHLFLWFVSYELGQPVLQTETASTNSRSTAERRVLVNDANLITRITTFLRGGESSLPKQCTLCISTSKCTKMTVFDVPLACLRRRDPSLFVHSTAFDIKI